MTPLTPLTNCFY